MRRVAYERESLELAENRHNSGAGRVVRARRARWSTAPAIA